MSTPKERLRMIFAGEKPDRPACICPGGMMNMVTEDLMEEIKTYLPEAHTDARKMADLARAVYEKGCFENCGVPFCMTVEAEEMGAQVDLGAGTALVRMKYPVEDAVLKEAVNRSGYTALRITHPTGPVSQPLL